MTISRPPPPPRRDALSPARPTACIEMLQIDLPALPGVDPRAFAAAFARHLDAQHLSPAQAGRLAGLGLPPLAARPFEGADSLARRAAEALAAAIREGRP